MVIAGVFAAAWLRFDSALVDGLVPHVSALPARQLFAISGLWLAVFATCGLYRRRNLVSGLREYQQVLTGSAATILLVIVVAFAWTKPYVSRGFLILALCTVVFFDSFARFIIRRCIRVASSHGWYLDRVLIVGNGRQAVALARQLQATSVAAAEVLGFLSEYERVGVVVSGPLRVLGEPLDLSAIAGATGATRAIIVESALSWESLHGLVQMMYGRSPVPMSLVPGLFDLHTTPMAPQLLGSVLTFAPRPLRIEGLEAVIKRTMDLVMAVPAALLSLPLMAALIGWTWLTSGSFGLMHVEYVFGESHRKLVQLTQPSWVRRAHLARLPELWEVVLGRESLLGPRPIAVDQLLNYGSAASFLAAVKPGFIGPWWITGLGRPSDTELELSFDLFYARNFSVWLDLEILVKAMRGLLGRDEAPALRWRTIGLRPVNTSKQSDPLTQE